MTAGRDRLLAALDVGSTKVSCFVARVGDDNIVRVSGIGHRVNSGVRDGTVVDIQATETAIRAAVDQAERMAGETVEDVVVSVTSGEPRSHIVEMDVSIDGHQVEPADVELVLSQARARIDPGERVVLHAFPACFAIDGSFGVREPVGMYGDRLSVAMHVVTASPGPIRNLEACVHRAHLNVAGFVLSPYASGLSALVDDEMALGAACVDIGGGATTVSVFVQNAMIHADIVPVGGHHVTQDIARGLLTPVDHAERLKTLYGSAIQSPADDRETIDVPHVGESDVDEDGYSSIPRSMLTGIIQPRVEEIFELVRDRLSASGFSGQAGRRVVLTGGAAQLPGCRELAQRVLDKQIRIGRPRRVFGLADATAGPAFSTCAGLLLHSVAAPRELGRLEAQLGAGLPANRIARVGQWLRDNF